MFLALENLWSPLGVKIIKCWVTCIHLLNLAICMCVCHTADPLSLLAFSHAADFVYQPRLSLVSYSDPTLCKGEGSGNSSVFSCLCWVSSHMIIFVYLTPRSTHIPAYQQPHEVHVVLLHDQTNYILWSDWQKKSMAVNVTIPFPFPREGSGHEIMLSSGPPSNFLWVYKGTESAQRLHTFS